MKPTSQDRGYASNEFWFQTSTKCSTTRRRYFAHLTTLNDRSPRAQHSQDDHQVHNRGHGQVQPLLDLREACAAVPYANTSRSTAGHGCEVLVDATDGTGAELNMDQVQYVEAMHTRGAELWTNNWQRMERK